MSDFDNLIEDDQPYRPTPASAPVPEPVVVVQQPRESKQGWLAGVFGFLAVAFLILWLMGRGGVSPGPSPTPVDGAYAAIFYDDKDFDEYDPEALSAMQAAGFNQFMDDKLTGWEKIDVDQLDEIKNLPKVYQELAALPRASLPWMTVKAGSKTTSQPITSGDKLLQDILRTIK